MLFLLLSAGLITDKVHILADNEEISMHRITKDSMYKYIYQYFNEANPLFLKPVDACRYYFTPDSFYLVVLDQKWERIIWLKCREEGKGFYTSGEAHRFGGTVHAPGLLRMPHGIDSYGDDIFVADYGNNRVLWLIFNKDEDTLTIHSAFTGPYNGKYLDHPMDVCVNYSFIYRYFYVLDKGRYVKVFYPYNVFLYEYDGDNDGINMDSIIGIGIRQISGTSNPPRYYVYLAGRDKIYLLKEKSGSPPVELEEVKYFPDANFTGIDVTNSGVFVVDSKRKRILCLAPDLSRSYFAYTSSSLSSGVFNITVHKREAVTFAPYLSSTGMDFFKIDLSGIPNDNPLNLTATGLEDRVILRWQKNGQFNNFERFIIQRKENDGVLWENIGEVSFSSIQTNYIYNDFTVESGKEYSYRVYGYRTDYYSKPSNQVSVAVPYCNRPTITSLTFQDSVVVIEWNDNSRKNKDYYVGKKVRGVVAGSGKDTLVWYHFGHVNDSICFFIDTFPIEGENIYRVAAIDSTNHYWYFDYDTIDIPFYKADSFRAVSLPDTSILFRWRDRTYLESAYSLRKDSLTGYMEPPVIPPDSCAFLYSDADLSMHRYYLVSWQKRDGVYFYWAICDSLDYQWHVDNEPPVLSVYGGGRVIGGDSVRIEWEAEDNNGIKEIWVNDVRLRYNIREYTYKGDYAGWHSVYVKVKDFWGYKAGSGVRAGIYYKDSVDISGFLSVQSNKALGKGMYFVYGDIPETGYYKVYYCINSKRWCVVDRYLYKGSRGRIGLTRAGEGDTVSAFMCMEDGERFRHYSDYKSKVWHTGGGGGGGGCPYLYVWTGKDYEFDNSLLPESEHKAGVFKDHYILTKEPSGDGIRLKIKEWDDWTFIDRVRLFRVLHPESVGIGIYGDKLIGYVEICEVGKAYDNLGFEWTDSVRTTGMGAYRGRKGKNGRLFTEFGIKGDYILADTKAVPPKITLASGKDTLYGRVKGSEYLTVTGEFEVLDSVGVIDYVRSVRKVSSRYVKKRRLKPEEIPDEMRRKDGRYYIIEPGDSVIISFRKDNGNNPHGWVEDYMIEVIGFYTKPGKALGGVYGMIKEPSLLVNFGKELWFSAGGIKGGTVEVEVYDITGRQVRRMEAKAGSTGRITGLPSGVYFVHIGERTFRGVIVK